MRYSRLQAYLETVLPKPQVHVMVEAFELLTSAGVDAQDHQIEQELALAEDGESSVLVQSMYNLATPLMIATLENFGIKVNAHVTLAEMTDVLQGLLTLENYGDPVTIMQACDNSEGPIECLSEILPLVGAYTAGHYLTLFEDVTATLLERIESSAKEQYEEPPGGSAETDNIRIRLMQYIGQVGSAVLMVLDSVRGGMRLGLPLETYLEPNLATLEAIARDQPDTLAKQILGFVLATPTATDQIRSACDNEFDSLCVDKANVTKADIALVKLLAELFP
jgi:hypothetical protein